MKINRNLTLAVLVLSAMAIMFKAISSTGYHDDLDGQVVTVEWEVLNLRNAPGNGAVLDSLACGFSLTLTGNVQEYLGSNHADIWYEVTLTNSRGEPMHGWVFASGVRGDR